MKTKMKVKEKHDETKVLLILNTSQANDFRIMVRLQDQWLRDKVDELLLDDKIREAFNLIVAKAEVDGYFPPGAKLTERPALTFVEDML